MRLDKHFFSELQSCNEMISRKEEHSFCKSLGKQMNELTPEQNMLLG